MSRSKDKHPDKVCPHGRKRCGVCSGSKAPRRRALAEDDVPFDKYLVDAELPTPVLTAADSSGTWTDEELDRIYAEAAAASDSEWVSTAELLALFRDP